MIGTLKPDRRRTRSPRTGRFAAAALVLGLVVAGCAADDPAVNAAAPGAASDGAATLATVGGGQIDIGSIEGSDTVLWFWAPW